MNIPAARKAAFAIIVWAMMALGAPDVQAQEGVQIRLIEAELDRSRLLPLGGGNDGSRPEEGAATCAADTIVVIRPTSAPWRNAADYNAARNSQDELDLDRVKRIQNRTSPWRAVALVSAADLHRSAQWGCYQPNRQELIRWGLVAPDPPTPPTPLYDDAWIKGALAADQSEIDNIKIDALRVSRVMFGAGLGVAGMVVPRAWSLGIPIEYGGPAVRAALKIVNPQNGWGLSIDAHASFARFDGWRFGVGLILLVPATLRVDVLVGLTGFWGDLGLRFDPFEARARYLGAGVHLGTDINMFGPVNFGVSLQMGPGLFMTGEGTDNFFVLTGMIGVTIETR